jgi:hypothetical protein
MVWPAFPDRIVGRKKNSFISSSKSLSSETSPVPSLLAVSPPDDDGLAVTRLRRRLLFPGTCRRHQPERQRHRQ